MERIYRAPYLGHFKPLNLPVCHLKDGEDIRSLKPANLKANESMNHRGSRGFITAFYDSPELRQCTGAP